MKKRVGIKKIVLAKQTVRELSSRELEATPVAAGAPPEYTAASHQDVCCA